MEAVFRQAGDQRLVSRHDEHRHRIVVGDVAAVHQQRQRGQAATAGADLAAAPRALYDDEVLQHTAVLDRRGEFGKRQRGCTVVAARLVVLGQDQLVERNEASWRRLD